jgi:uncharacterized protein YjiS (DUF1127 family)
MTRLTDRELDAVLKAKASGTPLATDLLIAEAKRLQGQALRRGIRTALEALSLDSLLLRIKREVVCRRTQMELASLDDATLRDIGLTRGEIYAQARRCANQTVQAA